MSNPWGIGLIPDNIPAELKQQGQFCAWRAIPKKHNARKMDKVPFSPTNYQQPVSTTSNKGWADFDAAVKAYSNGGNFNGIGWKVKKGWFVADLDNCVDWPFIDDAALSIMHRCDTYAEFSPSGQGVRIIGKGDVPEDVANHEHGVEIYGGNSDRYVTLTGHVIDQYTVINAVDQSVVTGLVGFYRTEKVAPEQAPMPLLGDPVDLQEYGWAPGEIQQRLFDASDRSHAVAGITHQLYGHGLNDEQVLSTLWADEDIRQVALSHRRNNEDKALDYLWRHHCLPARTAANATPFPNLNAPEPAIEQNQEVSEDPTTESALNLIPVTQWQGKEPRPREWAIEGLIPRGEVTALYGDGGVGKSLLALEMQTCIAMGVDFYGHTVTKGGVLGMYCEDSSNELHQRQIDINRKYLLQCDQITDSHVLSRVGMDNLLITFDGKAHGVPTDLWNSLHTEIQRLRPALLIVDTAADTFGGNENVRTEVRQFIQRALGFFAVQYNMAVLLLAHPSLSGMKSGTGGSTGWNNSVRSRLHFFRDEDNDQIRRLRVRKSNYASTGSDDTDIMMVWREGAFIDLATGGDILEDREAEANRVFLDLLMEVFERGDYVSNVNRGKYAPKVALEMARARGLTGFTVSRFEIAMEQLLTRRVLVLESHDSGRAKHLALTKKEKAEDVGAIS